MDHSPRTPEEQERLNKKMQELDQKMLEETERYYARLDLFSGRSIRPSLNLILRAFGLDVRNAISQFPAMFIKITGNWAGDELLKRGILALNNPA